MIDVTCTTKYDKGSVTSLSMLVSDTEWVVVVLVMMYYCCRWLRLLFYSDEVQTLLLRFIDAQLELTCNLLPERSFTLYR